MIKRYEAPNLLLDDEPIIKNVTGCNIHWREGGASLEASSNDDDIYGAIASGQGTTNNAKDDFKDNVEK